MSVSCDISPLDLLHHALSACVAGRLPEGERLLRQFVLRMPDAVDGWFNLGKVLKDMEKFDESVQAYRKACALAPQDPVVHYNLGNVLSAARHRAEALQEYREAVRLDPHLHDAHNNLGLLLEEAGDRKGAIACYERALHEAPGHGPAHMNLGLALLKEERLDEAEEHCRLAIAAAPASAEPHYNLALVLMARDRFIEADEEMAQALMLRSRFPEAWVNRAIGYQHTERTIEAIDACRRAIVERPDFAEAHLNLAVTLLQRGEFDEGWREYEWRFHTADGKNPRRYPHIPEWNGHPLSGKTILIYQEQGVGDILQCLRFVPILAQQAHRVLVACQPALQLLAQRVDGIAGVLGPNDDAREVDFVCPVFSLPRVFNVSPEVIPGSVPYLNPDPGRVERWGGIIKREPGQLHVGVAWTGNPAHSNNRRRSLPAADIRVLLTTPGVTFHSLHCGEVTPDPAARLHQYGDALNSFTEVAGLMKHLDLVLSIDTSFAHLAGGLGVPVWLMLNHGGDWRWMLHRTDSPWYPTMRIFRQSKPGDWLPVIADVRDALRGLSLRGSA
jgi:tetratricopeptide (TPR) repeat protein